LITSNNTANAVNSSKITVTTAQGLQPHNLTQNVHSSKIEITTAHGVQTNNVIHNMHSSKVEVSNVQQVKPVVVPSPITVHEVIGVQKQDVPVISHGYPAYIPNPMVQMPPQQ
jgi:hypothetical protein